MGKSEYSYWVGGIKEVNGNTITCTVMKNRVCNDFGRHPITTSLTKWKKQQITLTDAQMARFNSYGKYERRAYLTKVLALS